MALVVGAGFIAWERRTPEPMLPLSLFSNRRFSVGAGVNTTSFLVLIGFWFLLVLYVQFALGYTAFSVLLAMLANVGATSNLLGFDAGSLWIDALCGGPGRTHMAARSITVLPNLLLPTWLSAVVVGVWTGQWRAIAVIALLAVPVAILVLAQGLVTSLLAPWPLPDGDNPFGNRQAAEGRGGRLAAIALSGLACAVLAATPMLVAAAVGLDTGWIWLVPALGMVWAVLVGWLVLRWVERHLAANAIDLVERLSPIALN